MKKINKNIQEESDIIEKKSEILLKETTFEELLTKLQEYRDGKQIDSIWFNVFNYYMKNDRSRLENSLKSLNYTNIPEKISGPIRGAYRNVPIFPRPPSRSKENFTQSSLVKYFTYGAKKRYL